jgi:hypothetical protein
MTQICTALEVKAAEHLAENPGEIEAADFVHWFIREALPAWEAATAPKKRQKN